IVERREVGLRETLRYKTQQRGGFGERAGRGHQRRHATFGVYSEVFGVSLRLRTEIDRDRLVGRTGLFERDVRRQRTGAGRIVKPEHLFHPSTTTVIRLIASSAIAPTR